MSEMSTGKNEVRRETIGKRVMEVLVTHGWSVAVGAALAQKSYVTAVGRKVAHCYLEDFGASSENFVLKGEYWSEGRNALGACLVLIPKTASAYDAARMAKEFAVQADAGVSETYAAKVGASCEHAEYFIRCEESSLGVFRGLCHAMVEYDHGRGGIAATLSAAEVKRLEAFPADFKIESAHMAAGAAPCAAAACGSESNNLEP